MKNSKPRSCDLPRLLLTIKIVILMETQSKEKTAEIAIMDFRSLPEYQGARERQEALVTQNPYIECKDYATYTEAKKRRTALAQGRYELQNGQKTINNKIKEFKAMVDKETTALIEITKPYEDKQQAEVKRYEEEKKKEREEKARLERERIQNHQNSIQAFKDEKGKAIESATVKTIDAILEDIKSSMLEVEEFEKDFLDARAELVKTGNQKKAQLDEAERLRIEREELEKQKQKDEEARKERERVEAEKINRQNKLIELGLRFDGEQFIYKDVNFHWSEVVAMTGPQFAKQLAGAQARMEEIRKEEKAEEEKRENERKQFEEERRAMKAERDKYRKGQIEAIGMRPRGNFYAYGAISIHWNEIENLSPDDFSKVVESTKVKVAEEKKRKEEIKRKAEQEAKDKAAKEEAERKAKEEAERKRQEALKPDKQKAVEALSNIHIPSELELNDSEVRQAYESVVNNLSEVLYESIEHINQL